MTIKNYILMAIFFYVTVSVPAQADLPKEQIYSLFNQANQYFRQGNSANNPEQAKKYYEQAILSFERIIDEGGIRNAKLYYNLANAYLLHGQLGKAILNYRRATKLGNDGDIQKNLNFARSQRKDQVTIKTERRVLHTLFFWHYDFTQKTKSLMMCIFFGIVCISAAAMIWFYRSTPLVVTAIICGLLTICLLGSIVIEAGAESKRAGGVITTKEVVAYQGDSKNYPTSFKEPLHEGTEFELLERRPGWFHIKLSDDSEGWIPDDSAELI
jgi:tetratricopeptide (TPR) repeat protein